VKILRKAAENAGAGLIMVSPYDEGGLATFWLRRDWSGGVQIDLLRDPEGRGKLAFRTDIALRQTIRGKRWMKLAAPAEQAYLLSKRWVKRDAEALRQLRAEAGAILGFPPLDVLTPSRAHAVGRLQTTSTAFQLSVSPHLLRSRLSRRGLRRIRYPVGLLIGLAGDREAAARSARAVCDGLRPLVVRVDSTQGRSLAARVRRFVSLRRPHVLIAVGDVGRRPDIRVQVLDDAEPSEVLARLWPELVALSEVRVERQLSAHRFNT
jgi:hypothetical protein